MPRTANPTDWATYYADQLKELLAYWRRNQAAIRSQPSHQAADETLLCELVLVRAASIVETALHNLFVAHINRSQEKFKADLQTRLKSSLDTKLGKNLTSKVTLPLLGHLSQSDISDSIDPSGWNLTFKDGSEIKGKALEWLDDNPRTRGLRALSAHDSELFDVLIALRNRLVHGSAGSLQRMNAALAAVTDLRLQRAGPNTVQTVGSYLKASAPPRVEHLLIELQAMIRGFG